MRNSSLITDAELDKLIRSSMKKLGHNLKKHGIINLSKREKEILWFAWVAGAGMGEEYRIKLFKKICRGVLGEI